jgi:hypothetical protein
MKLNSRTVKYIASAALLMSCHLLFAQSRPQTRLERINAADGLPVAEKRSCTATICGPPPAAFAVPERLKATYEQIFNREIKSGLEAFISLAEQEASKYVELENKKTQISALTFSDRGIKVANFVWGFSELIKAAEYIEQTQTGMRFKSGFESKFPGMSQADIAFIRKLGEAVFNSEEFRQANILENVDFNSAMKMISNGRANDANLNDFKQIYAQLLLRKFNRLKELWPNLPFVVPPGIKLLSQGKDISSGQIAGITAAMPFLFIVKVLEDSEGIFLSRRPDFASVINRVFSNPRLALYKRELTQINALKTRALSFCKDQFDRTLSVHLTNQDLINASATAEEVRGEVLKTVRDLLGSDREMLSTTEKAVADVRFSFPLTTEAQIGKMRSVLALELREYRERVRLLKSAPLEDQFLIAMTQTQSEANSVFEPVAKFCVESAPEKLSDHAITAFGHIGVGWETVKFPVSGRSIMAHEFGHIIFSQLNRREQSAVQSLHPLILKFTQLKRCMAGKHGQQTSRMNTDNEDFADWIASKVAVSFRAGSTSIENIGCILLKGNQPEYGGLNGITLKWSPGYPDSHSPSYFRLLQFEVESGQTLAPICKAQLDQVLPAAAHQACQF